MAPGHWQPHWRSSSELPALGASPRRRDQSIGGTLRDVPRRVTGHHFGGEHHDEAVMEGQPVVITGTDTGGVGRGGRFDGSEHALTVA